MKGTPEHRRVSLATATAGLAAAIVYVVACIYDRIVSGLADPFLIVRDVHFGYYHRAVLAAWLGGIAGLIAARLLDSPERVSWVTRVLTRATLPTVVLLSVATYLFP
ncbi:MAG: hypothetical protein J0L92_12455 [Deltaproteobacteria bacterium]|nr:hypothetical protein [Deltaproteobacteria bacterium]